jgi:hypothetical protein
VSDAYVLRAADDVALWAIEYVRSPAPRKGKASGYSACRYPGTRERSSGQRW